MNHRRVLTTLSNTFYIAQAEKKIPSIKNCHTHTHIKKEKEGRGNNIVEYEGISISSRDALISHALI